MSNNNPLTYEERKLIEKYVIKLGVSCGETAKILGRGKNTIVVEVRRAGGINYTAKAGQEYAEIMHEQRYNKLVERNSSYPITMKQRIESLEMQVQILSETIKRLLGNDSKN